MGQVRKQFSAVYSNGDFIYLETRSGDVAYAADPLGRTHLFDADVSQEAIGLALVDCLSCSRFISYEADPSFFDDLAFRKQLHDAWVGVLAKKYKYRSRGSLLSGVDLCGVEKFNGKIHILPHCHVRREVWIRRQIEASEDVIIPAESSPEEIGKAVQLALSRCTTE